MSAVFGPLATRCQSSHESFSLQRTHLSHGTSPLHLTFCFRHLVQLCLAQVRLREAPVLCWSAPGACGMSKWQRPPELPFPLSLRFSDHYSLVSEKMESRFGSGKFHLTKLTVHNLQKRRRSEVSFSLWFHELSLELTIFTHLWLQK